jgi:RNA-directed DNA polymerase
MAKQDDKARLYNRITQVHHAIVLDRMRVNGFWPSSQGLPPDPAPEAQERKLLEADLAVLKQDAAMSPGDVEKALKAERLRRWEESKKKRAEKKKLREARAAARRAAWVEKRKGLVFHAGDGHSGGLQHVTSDESALVKRGLPVLHNAHDLAVALGLSLGRLRWLTYHRNGATLVHYHRYSIPKKTGGIRGISAPKPALAKAQKWVFDSIVQKLTIEPEAHGFVVDRSIVSNAKIHVGKRVVSNMDLKDFFPSVTYRRTKGLFVSFGYSEQVATLIALLCTEPPRVAASIDGKPVHIAIGERRLPQGACTSPGLTNAVCRALDRRLAGLAQKLGFDYSRYADDLTFSGNEDRKLGLLLRSARSIVKDEGFLEHPTKTRVMRRGRRQEVTGVVVNDRPTIPREELRELRAILHNAMRQGLEAQNRKSHPRFIEHLQGRVAYVAMVDPVRGEKLKQALARVLGR